MPIYQLYLLQYNLLQVQLNQIVTSLQYCDDDVAFTEAAIRMVNSAIHRNTDALEYEQSWTVFATAA